MKIYRLLGCVVALGLMCQVADARSFTRREDSQGEVVAPFGFPSTQPPPQGSVINLSDFQVGLEAQQVCGYTDWSTIQLRTPKKLLSKEYWRQVGKGLQDEATNLAMSLTGALPAMLACNVSPTYCHVFNQAEMMSAFEGQLTFNTCQMLDGVANTSMTQAEGLRNCVSTQMKNSRGLTASEARERCLTSPDNADLKKGDKIARTGAQGDPADSFSTASFIKSVFPDEVAQAGGQSYSLHAGPYQYSRLSQSRTLMADLFPGVEVRQNASVMRGGTFNPTVDRRVVSRAQVAQDKIREVLRAMKPLQDQGFTAAQIISKTRKTWEDREAWNRQGEPSPLYRARSDGGEPSLLVTPEQMLMLLPLSQPGESDPDKALDTPEMKQVIDRLAESVSHVQVNDLLAEIYTRTLDRCRRDPAYQGAVAQENCHAILERTKSEMEILAYKREAAAQARAVQVEIAGAVRDVQAQRLTRTVKVGHEAPEPAAGPIPLPGHL